MTDYKLYPNLPWGHAETLGPEGPSALPENPQVDYHLNVVQAKKPELINKKRRCLRRNTRSTLRY